MLTARGFLNLFVYRLPPAGLFSNRQHRGDTTAENGTPLTGVGTPGMLINDSATASPNPHEHYAAINQAVMDKVWPFSALHETTIAGRNVHPITHHDPSG